MNKRLVKGALDAPGSRRLLVFALVLAGVLVRVWRFGATPGGLNQDEAYAGYEAYSLLTTGMDSWGYRFPVYLRAWGSGMNALESYLMIPFIAAFGLKTWVIRLPQLLVACASLPALYGLLRRMLTQRAAIIGLFVLAISPWHIMMARWGLESNLAPGMLLFGMYFFVRGAENSRWFIPSAAFYGLSLYAYATIWPVVPAMLLMLAGWLRFTGRLKIDRWLAVSIGLLALLAAPLLLFVLVNVGILPEIRTAFFSVPRLLSMRTYDFAPGNMYENLYDMVFMMLRQRDDTLWNATREFGLYYHISLPFMVIGGVCGLIRLFRSVKTREWDALACVMCQLLCAVVLGLFIESNVNRLNCIHFPAIILTALGVETAAGWFGRRRRAALGVMTAAYSLSFALFVGYYFGGYGERVGEEFHMGLEEAVAFADGAAGETGGVAVSQDILYSKLLFCLRTPPQAFRESAGMLGESDMAFIELDRLGKWRFDAELSDAQGMVLLAPLDELQAILPQGYEMRVFDTVAVAWPQDALGE